MPQSKLLPLLTMMLAANAGNETGHANHLNNRLPFNIIKCDESITKWNTVFCSLAQENFRAGETVELSPPVHINNYVAQVASILKVDQQSSPQRVLLSLFLDVTSEMKIKQLKSPAHRSYILYPSKLLVWTRYQGWFPTTRI